MAIQEWAIVSPKTGSNNQAIVLTVRKNYGRNPRSTELTLSAVGVPDDKKLLVSQDGADAFISPVSGQSLSFQVGGGSLDFLGETNANTLTWSIQAENEQFQIESVEFSIDGRSWTPIVQDSPILGDPGATNKYNIKVTVSAKQNTAIESYTGKAVIVAGEQQFEIELSQSADTPTLELSAESIELAKSGAAKTVQVTSNATWDVKQN